MAYNKHTWAAREGKGLNKFTDQNGKVYEFTPTPDEVTQPGTPFSAVWMNEMEAGIAAAGIIYAVCSTAADVAAKTVDTGGAPETLAAGDHFRIMFENEVPAGATLNINNLGAYPIIDNYTGAAIVKGDIPADYIGDIMFEGEKFLLLNAESFTPKNANIMQFVNGVASTLGGNTVSLDGKVKIETGTYTGNGSHTRSITTTISPKLFIVVDTDTANYNAAVIVTPAGAFGVCTRYGSKSGTIFNYIYLNTGSCSGGITDNTINWTITSTAVFNAVSSGGKVSVTDYSMSCNRSNATYSYVAIGY